MSYLSEVYSEKRRPFTSYPGKLCKYLADKYFKAGYKTLLDIGCGRGEHMREFQQLGYEVSGIDISEEAKTMSEGFDVKVADIGKEPLPYEDNSFDVLFNKSLIEHLIYPEHLIKESWRVLKP